MFIFNIKLDGNKASKVLIGIFCVIVLIITFFICYKLCDVITLQYPAPC